MPSSPSRPSSAPVAVDEAALVGEPFLGGVDGRQHAGVVGGKEPDERHHQVRGVEVVGAERLGERADPLAPALAAGSPRGSRPGCCVHASTRSAASSRSASAIGPVERDPAHQLRVDEVPRLAAHLPDALVLLLPARAPRCRRARRGTGACRVSSAARPLSAGLAPLGHGSKSRSESRCTALSSSP